MLEPDVFVWSLSVDPLLVVSANAKVVNNDNVINNDTKNSPTPIHFLFNLSISLIGIPQYKLRIHLIMYYYIYKYDVNYKLQTFEIPQVKESTNRTLKSKIRKAKNAIEMQAYATILLMEIMNEEEKSD